MDREVSVADCKHNQRTNKSQLQYMPGAERHTKVLTNVRAQLSDQISGLCRHNESYEHKDANRHAEKVIKCQVVYQK